MAGPFPRACYPTFGIKRSGCRPDDRWVYEKDDAGADMSLGDKQAIERSTDDHLGFGGSAKETDETARQDPQTESDEASYVDSWYQVLKVQAADEA
jgi:hypothetical protein